jgi:hypothetical protein
MRVTLLFILLNVFCLSIAQEKKAEIELRSHTDLKRPIFLPDQNLILITSRYAMKAETTAYCFSPDGDKLWEKKIPVLLPVATQKTNILTTPDGNTILVVQQQDRSYNNGPHQIVMLKRNGDEKTFKIEGKKEFGKNLLKAFCDNNYLYYLASMYGEEKHKDRKSGDKLILNRFSLNDFSYKRFILDLPQIKEGRNTTFWSLIGQRGEEKFLVSKSIDKEAGKNTFTVVTVNFEGKTLNTKVFETALTNGKFTRPSYSWFENPWEREFVELDYSQGQGPPGSNYSYKIAHDGAFGHIIYNDLHDCFYIYGLSGPEPLKKEGDNDGFYIKKFAADGKLIWDLLQPASTQLLSEKHFHSKSEIDYRKFSITPLPNNDLKADIQLSGVRFRFFITPDGKTKSEVRSEKKEIIDGVITSDKNLKSTDYVSKNQNSYVYINVYQQSESELVVKHDYQKLKVEVISFK